MRKERQRETISNIPTGASPITVIMQWDDLPTDIQRELFEHAISMSELHHTASGQNQTLRIREITGIPQVLAIFAGTKRQILSTS
jgi:hypothetical protein